MCRSTSALLALLFLAAASAPAAAAKYPGIGRPATPAEIAAWDIDVRPDFQGLPKGSGSVAEGQRIWDAQCASCHGVFGESNEVFTPLTGGTTAEDIKTGRAATLATTNPTRSTLSKLSTISTLWDYIRRAMPWTAPKSLSVNEVYAVTAYLLHLGDIVPADFVLSDANIAEVQQRLPNRNGMTRDHGLWDIDGEPDVKNVACMKNCPTEAKIVSFLPEHARDMHGNLADQNRLIGGVRGVETLPRRAVAAAPTPEPAPPAGERLAEATGCLACHQVQGRRLGPGFDEVAARYRGEPDARARLVAKVRAGGAGTWGSVPMPPQGHVKEEDLSAIVEWILSGSP